MFEIHCVPIYQDNYVWILSSAGRAWVIDPGDHRPVLHFLGQQQLTLSGVLITHRHWDHVTGVKPLLDALPHGQIPVYGPDSPPINHLVTHALTEGDRIALGPLEIKVWSTPGHTLDHISFYIPDQEMLFCGDTLFACGCGRLFDGSLEQLYHSLCRIARSPSSTRVYCTHEYTLANIDFALAAEPDNDKLLSRQRHVQQLRTRNLPTLPTTIGDELATNPFLRCNEPSVQKSVEKETGTKFHDEFCCFSALRNWKNRY